MIEIDERVDHGGKALSAIGVAKNGNRAVILQQYAWQSRGG
jgi:hypothetical protein